MLNCLCWRHRDALTWGAGIVQVARTCRSCQGSGNCSQGSTPHPWWPQFCSSPPSSVTLSAGVACGRCFLTHYLNANLNSRSLIITWKMAVTVNCQTVMAENLRNLLPLPSGSKLNKPNKFKYQSSGLALGPAKGRLVLIQSGSGV